MKSLQNTGCHVEFRGPPLTRELRAYAGLLPLLKGDWTNRWSPEVYCSDTSEKRMVLLRRAQHWFLSSCVMVVFWSVPFARSASVGKRRPQEQKRANRGSQKGAKGEGRRARMLGWPWTCGGAPPGDSCEGESPLHICRFLNAMHLYRTVRRAAGCLTLHVHGHRHCDGLVSPFSELREY